MGLLAWAWTIYGPRQTFSCFRHWPNAWPHLALAQGQSKKTEGASSLSSPCILSLGTPSLHLLLRCVSPAGGARLRAQAGSARFPSQNAGRVCPSSEDPEWVSPSHSSRFSLPGTCSEAAAELSAGRRGQVLTEQRSPASQCCLLQHPSAVPLGLWSGGFPRALSTPQLWTSFYLRNDGVSWP